MTREDWHVVITQSGARGRDLTSRLSEHGLSASHVPLITTLVRELDGIAAQLKAIPEHVDGWIFTSSTAAKTFVTLLSQLSGWKWGKPVCYCIGERTAECLEAASCIVRCFDDVADSADLARRIIDLSDAGSTYVFVRGEQARKTISVELEAAGHSVTDVIVYDTKPVHFVGSLVGLTTKHILWVLFSPSGVHSFVHSVPNARALVEERTYMLMPFGRTTKAAVDELGLPSLSTPMSVTHDALLTHILHSTTREE